MDEVSIKNLSIINNEKGDILKGFLKSDNKTINVKEVYFSEINPKQIKAWKRTVHITSSLILCLNNVLFLPPSFIPSQKQ